MTDLVKFIVGNWKMNGERTGLAEVEALVGALADRPVSSRVGLCPPTTMIARVGDVARPAGIEIGGQDCHAEARGAFTGNVSAALLAEAGARLVILGHSERRARHGETDAEVAAKVEAALGAGLEPIVCLGETLDERQAGKTLAVVRGQAAASLPMALAGRAFAVAYEPVWAIGTGLTPTLYQIAEVHAAVRAAIIERLGEGTRTTPILYGGSVNPANAADILGAAEVGGALVGGASLKAEDFLAIVRAAEPARVAAGAQG